MLKLSFGSNAFSFVGLGRFIAWSWWIINVDGNESWLFIPCYWPLFHRFWERWYAPDVKCGIYLIYSLFISVFLVFSSSQTYLFVDSKCIWFAYFTCANNWISDYLRKIIVQGRSSKSTKVGDIMTEEVLTNSDVGFCLVWLVNFKLFADELVNFCIFLLVHTYVHMWAIYDHIIWWLQNKLITVTPNTKVLLAMQLMTGLNTAALPWNIYIHLVCFLHL